MACGGHRFSIRRQSCFHFFLIIAFRDSAQFLSGNCLDRSNDRAFGDDCERIEKKWLVAAIKRNNVQCKPTTTVYEELAQCFMDYADRLPFSNRPENQPYPRRHLDWIAQTAGAFFGQHPHLMTDEVIERIATGDGFEKLNQFGHLTEFHPLDKALESYFKSLQPKPKKAPLFGFLRGLVHWNEPQMAHGMSYNSTVNS
jgi:hypothetical protein